MPIAMPTAELSSIEQDRFADLIARVALRDQAAFQQLYEKTSARAYGLALRMMGTAQPAQDLLQEAYLKVWANASEYRPDKGRVLSWLLGIVRYRALDALRAGKRHGKAMDSHLQSEQQLNPQAGLVMPDENSEGLAHCLQTLAASQRESIVQAFVYGWTYDELAARTAKPIGTIKSQIRRGLARLKECLER